MLTSDRVFRLALFPGKSEKETSGEVATLRSPRFREPNETRNARARPPALRPRVARHASPARVPQRE